MMIVRGSHFHTHCLSSSFYPSPSLIINRSYVLMIALSGLFVYLYLMWVYLNGRIRDLYQRVHGTERAFFIPEDLELSLGELEWIIVKVSESAVRCSSAVAQPCL